MYPPPHTIHTLLVIDTEGIGSLDARKNRGVCILLLIHTLLVIDTEGTGSLDAGKKEKNRGVCILLLIHTLLNLVIDTDTKGIGSLDAGIYLFSSVFLIFFLIAEGIGDTDLSFLFLFLLLSV